MCLLSGNTELLCDSFLSQSEKRTCWPVCKNMLRWLGRKCLEVWGESRADCAQETFYTRMIKEMYEKSMVWNIWGCKVLLKLLALSTLLIWAIIKDWLLLNFFPFSQGKHSLIKQIKGIINKWNSQILVSNKFLYHVIRK